VNKKTQVKLLISLAIGLSLAGLIFFSAPTRTYQILELKALDLRFALKGSHPSQTPIVHIDIDDQSLMALGRWPWPRNYHAKLISILKECGAGPVLMDVLFSEEFKDNPKEDVLFAEAIAASGKVYLPFYFVEKQSGLSQGLRDLFLKDITISPQEAAKRLNVPLSSLRDDFSKAKKIFLEEIMADLLRQNPELFLEGLLEKMETTYGWFLFPEEENYINENFSAEKSAAVFIKKFSLDLSKQPWPFLKQEGSLSVPLQAFMEQIKGSGFINANPDIDGVTRKVPLFVRFENSLFPQLTVAALKDLLQVKAIETTPETILFKNALWQGQSKDIAIPVDKSGCMLVNWQGKWGQSFKHIPYYLILKLQNVRDELVKALEASPQSSGIGTVDYLKKTEAELVEKLRGMVQNKICIVGLTATGTHDLRPIPLQENYPMVGTHSNLIHTILTGNFIVKKEGTWRLVIFLVTALVIAFSSLLKLGKSFLLSLGYLLGYCLLAFYLFNRFGLWVDMVGPLGIVVFGFSGITSFRFLTEEKEKLWIKQAFSHYLSKEVISELMEDPSRLKLGGERRLITVLFSDVRGFTTFSESHQPEEVVGMLNEILGEQVKVIFKYNGTLDKFVGDEVMAFFGAPGTHHLNDHALTAVRTAFEIQARMKELQARWAQENKEILSIGIGINTGDMVVGNTGSAERMDYTVIGDNVNLAARLCSAAGKNEIIVSESTYLLVANEVLAEKLEPISVKGKSKPIAIYRITGLKEMQKKSG